MSITIRDLMYAAKLKWLREQKNVKQYNAAFIIGVDCQQHYSNYENGKQHFTDDIIRKICEGFKISFSEFKKVDLQILDEMIRSAGLTSELQTFIKKHLDKERQLYLLECEKRLVETKLDNLRKNKEILELKTGSPWIKPFEVPKIYVMA